MRVKVRPTGASYNRPASPICPLKKSGPRAHRLCDDSIHIQVSKMQTNLQGEKADPRGWGLGGKRLQKAFTSKLWKMTDMFTTLNVIMVSRVCT